MKLPALPLDTGKEIAVMGRSNAGKSSLINAVSSNGRIMKTSKTPGRTQAMNVLYVGGSSSKRLVDFPGLGYARFSQALRQYWFDTCVNFIENRRSLKAVLYLLDCRHGLQPMDTAFISHCLDSHRAVLCVLTKADKLSRSAANRQQRQLGQAIHVPTLLFSTTQQNAIQQLIDWFAMQFGDKPA